MFTLLCQGKQNKTKQNRTIKTLNYMSVCPCLGLPQPGTVAGDMQNSRCMRSGMCSAVREQGAVPCAVRAAGDPRAAKTLSGGGGSPLAAPAQCVGKGVRIWSTTLLKDLSVSFFFVSLKKKTTTPNGFESSFDFSKDKSLKST